MKNQGGFATIEIILVVLIIGVLSTIALPKMARLVDIAAIDYEMKIFLSNLDFAKSLNKNFYYEREIFSNVVLKDAGAPLQINVNAKLNRYTIMQDTKRFSEPYYLPTGFSIICEKGMPNQIEPDKNYSGHIKITSRHNFNRYIISDSAGRWRGDITPP